MQSLGPKVCPQVSNLVEFYPFSPSKLKCTLEMLMAILYILNAIENTVIIWSHSLSRLLFIFFSRLVIDIDQTALVLLKVEPFANVSDRFEFLNLSRWEAKMFVFQGKRRRQQSRLLEEMPLFTLQYLYKINRTCNSFSHYVWILSKTRNTESIIIKREMSHDCNFTHCNSSEGHEK